MAFFSAFIGGACALAGIESLIEQDWKMASLYLVLSAVNSSNALRGK